MNCRLYKIRYDCVFVMGGESLVSARGKKRAKNLLEEKLKENYKDYKYEGDFGFEVTNVKKLECKTDKERVITLNFKE